MILPYEVYQHLCWRNKNPWQRSWQRYRIGVDSVLLPGLRQLPLVDLNVPHGHLQRVPLQLYQLLWRLQVKKNTINHSMKKTIRLQTPSHCHYKLKQYYQFSSLVHYHIWLSLSVHCHIIILIVIIKPQFC